MKDAKAQEVTRQPAAISGHQAASGLRITTGAILEQRKLPNLPPIDRGFLLPQDTLRQVMTVEENIDFIKSQIAVFHTMERENVRLVAARRSQVAALREEVSEIRDRVRSVRASLIPSQRFGTNGGVHPVPGGKGQSKTNLSRC